MRRPSATIESIEVDVSGASGVVHTRAVLLQDGSRSYRWGGVCHASVLGPAVLEQLHAAMDRRAPVTLTGRPIEAKAGGELWCLRSVEFFPHDAKQRRE